tara:strand:- start:1934 stop:2569 length:636 start_codon:yes stop_codon:yes gene_type:complete
MDKFKENEYDYLLKFVVIGDKKSGKTTFINQLVLQKFTPFYSPTIGIEFSSSYNTLQNSDKIIKTTSWDITGSRKFINHISSYFNSITFALLFVNITDENALSNLQFWYDIFKEKTKGKDIPCAIIATHYDQHHKRKIAMSDIKRWAKDKTDIIYEVDNTNTSEIHDIFRHILNCIMNRLDMNSGMYCYRPPKKEKSTADDSYFKTYCSLL